MKTLFTLLLFAVISNTVTAQLFFHNNTTKPVLVAYAAYYDIKGTTYWYTDGWYTVEPGENAKIGSTGMSSSVYYYAQAKDGSKSYSGEQAFLVDPTKAFYINNANMQYQETAHPEYKWRKFREEKLSTGDKLIYRHTIELNY